MAITNITKKTNSDATKESEFNAMKDATGDTIIEVKLKSLEEDE